MSDGGVEKEFFLSTHLGHQAKAGSLANKHKNVFLKICLVFATLAASMSASSRSKNITQVMLVVSQIWFECFCIFRVTFWPRKFCWNVWHFGSHVGARMEERREASSGQQAHREDRVWNASRALNDLHLRPPQSTISVWDLQVGAPGRSGGHFGRCNGPSVQGMTHARDPKLRNGGGAQTKLSF